jgi:hypothetical protein
MTADEASTIMLSSTPSLAYIYAESCFYPGQRQPIHGMRERQSLLGADEIFQETGLASYKYATTD